MRDMDAASDEGRSQASGGLLSRRTRIHNAALNLALLVIRDTVSLRSEA